MDVIIIDDNEGVRWVLKELFKEQEISCILARDGREGLNKMTWHKPRVAIVDIKLGGMNGLEVARKIFAMDPRVKILFITGYNEAIKDKVENNLPVLGIIEKPFDVNDILRAVEKGLKKNTIPAYYSRDSRGVIAARANN